MKKQGIYCITNNANRKTYIGSAINLTNRWAVHLYNLRKNKHNNLHLQNAFNKYGEDNFVFSVIEEISVSEELIIREQHYIDTLKPEYNIRNLAHSNLGLKFSEDSKAKITGENNHFFGKTHTKESKRKISQSRIGKKLSEETKLKMSESSKGKIVSEETKLKLSILNKGKRPSEQTLLAAAKINKGRIPWNKGLKKEK